jgi:hypothetical protein
MTAAESLENKLKNIQSGDSATLLQARRVCRASGESFDRYLSFIPQASIEQMDDRQRYVISELFDPAELDFNLDSSDLTDQLENANSLLEDQFRLVEHYDQLMFVRVEDAENKLATPMFDGDVREILTRSLCQRVLDLTHQPIPPKEARKLVDLWANYADSIPMPQPMARFDEDVWAFHKPVYQPDASIKLVQWQKVLDRLSDPQAFAAWVWGIFSGLYKGRKILWLHGPSGEDGKSAIASLIANELFGPAHCAISNAAVKSEKRFLTSFFETAALVIYPDASNRKVLLSEVFKTIASAGADPVLIERKGKQAYTARLSARLWINSNFSPEVPDSKFATSRLLYLNISGLVGEKPDPTAIDRLRNELPGFLHYAEQAYAERCTDDYEIQVNEETEKLVAGITGSFYEEFENVFNKYWVVGTEDDRIVASTIQDRCKSEGITKHDYSNFKTWLEEQKGITTKKLSSQNGKIFYLGIKPATGTGESNIVRPSF